MVRRGLGVINVCVGVIGRGEQGGGCVSLPSFSEVPKHNVCLVSLLNNVNWTGLDMHAGQAGQTQTCCTSSACFTDLLSTDECVYLWITV